jgi:putative membrane protein
VTTLRQPAETGAVRWLIAALSVGVSLAVIIALALGPAASAAPLQPTLLARVNVALNASAGVFLLAGFAFIRSGNIVQHKRCMLTAFGLSSAFLVGYLFHHAQVGSIPFRGTGALRTLYFTILIPHILLAAGIVPLALLTLYRGWTGRVAAHRKIARYTLPLWLFVSASGVAVYGLLYYA